MWIKEIRICPQPYDPIIMGRGGVYKARTIYAAHGLGMPPEKKPRPKACRKWWEEEVEEKEDVKNMQAPFFFQ